VNIYDEGGDVPQEVFDEFVQKHRAAKSVFCKLAHNASIRGEGGTLTIYADSGGVARYELSPSYGEIVAMIHLDEGRIHIETTKEILALRSREPHEETFLIYGRWEK
jgi:hypothetical protein